MPLGYKASKRIKQPNDQVLVHWYNTMSIQSHLYCSPEAELPGVLGESADEEEAEEEGVGTKSSLRMMACLEHRTGCEGWDILANTACKQRISTQESIEWWSSIMHLSCVVSNKSIGWFHWASSRESTWWGLWQMHGTGTIAAEALGQTNRPLPAPLRKTIRNWASSVLALATRRV